MDLEKILRDHKMWLDGIGGERANLRWADLSGADLSGADLRVADLRWANLRDADLSEADLHGADLRWADLRWANLSGANLSGANLSGAGLHGANLSEADLSRADIDFSCWPLWCGSLHATLDDQQQRQLAYHLSSVLTIDSEWVAGLKEFANGWNGIERHSLSKIE